MKALKSFEPVPSQGFPIKYHYVVNLYKHQELDLSQFSLPFFFQLSPWGDKVEGSQEI